MKALTYFVILTFLFCLLSCSKTTVTKDDPNILYGKVVDVNNHTIDGADVYVDNVLEWWSNSFAGTLPVMNGKVEISPFEILSFNAVRSGTDTAQLIWTTSDEDEQTGFMVYRSVSNDSTTAQPVTSGIINAGYHDYLHYPDPEHYHYYEDTGLQTGHTYYYWLRVVTANSYSGFYGPSHLNMGIFTPVSLPDSRLEYYSPHPFTSADNTIFLWIQEHHTGTLTITSYASPGKVRTYNLSEGYHNVHWDLKDDNGEFFRNGITKCSLQVFNNAGSETNDEGFSFFLSHPDFPPYAVTDNGNFHISSKGLGISGAYYDWYDASNNYRGSFHTPDSLAVKITKTGFTPYDEHIAIDPFSVREATFTLLPAKAGIEKLQ